MKHYKDLRKKLGFSQQEFADLNGFKKGHLAMSESGKRTLPTINQKVLAVLENTDPLNTTTLAKSLPSLKKTTIAILNKTIKQHQVKLGKLQLLAENIENKIQTANTMITVTQALASVKNQDETTRLQQQVMQRQAAEKLVRYQQQWVGYQIAMAGLQASIDKAMALKNI
jgi:transcriptional regulator with XRE-family HTH domain